MKSDAVHGSSSAGTTSTEAFAADHSIAKDEVAGQALRVGKFWLSDKEQRRRE